MIDKGLKLGVLGRLSDDVTQAALTLLSNRLKLSS
jgi:hypothetical protein